jgi:hypothetical protein
VYVSKYTYKVPPGNTAVIDTKRTFNCFHFNVKVVSYLVVPYIELKDKGCQTINKLINDMHTSKVVPPEVCQTKPCSLQDGKLRFLFYKEYRIC